MGCVRAACPAVRELPTLRSVGCTCIKRATSVPRRTQTFFAFFGRRFRVFLRRFRGYSLGLGRVVAQNCASHCSPACIGAVTLFRNVAAAWSGCNSPRAPRAPAPGFSGRAPGRPACAARSAGTTGSGCGAARPVARPSARSARAPACAAPRPGRARARRWSASAR